MRIAVSSIFGIAIAACGPAPVETGGTASGSSGATTGGGPVEQPAICERYLACVAVESPATLAELTQGYGSDGTCWEGDEETVTNCTTACRAGILDFVASSSHPACDECDTDEHCEIPLPACGDRTCVECSSNDHCTHPAWPACGNGACVECVYNTDCPDPAEPVCQNATCNPG